jgi:hypothetical protein
MRGTRWSVLRSLSVDTRCKVKIHGRETKEFTQKEGYVQGPTGIPTKYNTSTEPLLIALEEAGAGVMIDGENILGYMWSDDLWALVPEHRLSEVMLCISKSAKTYRKKLKASKSWAIPMCNKKRDTDRPSIELDGKAIPTPQTTQTLGFTLSPSVQVTRVYAVKLRTKTKIAIAN